MLAIDHPIQVNNQYLLGWQAAFIQLLQLCRALLDELAAHARLRNACCLSHLADHFLIVPRRDPAEQQLQHPRAHPSIVLQRGVGGNRYFPGCPT